MAEKTLDLLGVVCPLPALKTRQALAYCESGDVLIILADDRFAEIDIMALARETGNTIQTVERGEGKRVTIRMIKR